MVKKAKKLEPKKTTGVDYYDIARIIFPTLPEPLQRRIDKLPAGLVVVIINKAIEMMFDDLAIATFATFATKGSKTAR